MTSFRPAGPLCHMAFSSLHNASRIWREAGAALSSGQINSVLAIGYQEDGYAEYEEPAAKFNVVRLPRIKFPLPRLFSRSLQFLFWSFAAARLVRAQQASLIHVHSLAALPAGVMAKRKLGIPLIYDAHELETERTGWGRLQKTAARLLEKALIRHSDHVFVVGDMIADWYRQKYHTINLTVLRNVPLRPATPIKKTDYIHQDLNIPDDEIIFLYLGIIDEGRGYQILIDTFRNLPLSKHLVFMGDGLAKDKVIVAAQTTPNIHWHKPVSAEAVVSYAAGADVGISLIEDTCLSYRYCLPNKLHEYRLAGLPVIVSNLPEMARLVSSTEAGWIIEPKLQALLKLLQAMTVEDITRQQERASRYAPLSWEGEQHHYLDILRNLLEKRG